MSKAPTFKVKVKIVIMFALTGLAVFAVPDGRQSAQTRVETAAEKFKNIKVLNDMPADQLGKVMNMMSASLGVNCGFCHASNDGDYEKEGFEHKDIARQMIRMTLDINKTYYDGKPEINCNTCHNGRPMPSQVFPLGATPPRPKRQAVNNDSPGVETILAKYESALGGRRKLVQVRSRIITSLRLEPDGKTTESETIYLDGERYSADLLYGEYLVREMFDGAMSRKFGMSSPIELKPDEEVQIKRDAQMFSPARLKRSYKHLSSDGREVIDGRDAYVVVGTDESGATERLFFDTITGLLVRRTAASPTIFGDFIYRVEYGDYKLFDGVRLPTTIKYAVPHMGWTRRILAVKTNVPVDASVFAAPPKK